MDDIRRVPANTLVRTAGHKGWEEKVVLWHGVKILVKPFLSFSEYIDAIHLIIDYCTNDDGSTRYEMVDIAVRVGILSSYAMVRIPQEINDLIYVIQYSDLYETILSEICAKQVDSIISSAKKIIYGGD